MQLRKAIKDIVWKAVNTVLEHCAATTRGEFEADRLELAKYFQIKCGSGDRSDSNASADFIGVFDTVATLGASGTRRLISDHKHARFIRDALPQAASLDRRQRLRQQLVRSSSDRRRYHTLHFLRQKLQRPRLRQVLYRQRHGIENMLCRVKG